MDSQMGDEYRDYLRHQTHHGQGVPLSPEDYRDAVLRWEREYDLAWEREDFATIRELELLLSA